MTMGHLFSGFHFHCSSRRGHGPATRVGRWAAAVLNACRGPIEFVLLPLGLVVALLLVGGEPHPWVLRSLGMSGTADDVLLDGLATHNLTWVEAGIRRGASPDATDWNGFTALMWAAEAGDEDLVHRLLAAGANVSARSRLDGTALAMAASSDRAGVIRLLLDAGAEVDQPIRIGTSLHYAAARGQSRAVAALLEGGADPNTRGRWGDTPLIKSVYGACETGATVVTLLLKAGADVDAADDQGRTALMEAAREGRGELIGLLLDAGADPNLRDRDGRTAADLARENGREALLSMLRAAS